MTAKKKRTRAAKPKTAKRKRSKARSSSSSSAPKRRRTRSGGRSLVVEVAVPRVVGLNGPDLAQLTPEQRLELAELGSKRRHDARPSWVADDALWKRALRQLASTWAHREHPYATVAFIYLRQGGQVIARRVREVIGGERHHPRSSARRHAAPGGGIGGPAELSVTRVRLDELGYSPQGQYYGRGEPLWLVSSTDPEAEPQIYTHVRAATAGLARRQVLETEGLA